MAQAVSQTMAAKAQQLATIAHTWNRGRSKVDGTGFYVVPASDGTSAHYTSIHGCTCKSYRNRGVCSHVEALRIVQRQHDAATAAQHPDPRRRYEELFPVEGFA